MLLVHVNVKCCSAVFGAVRFAEISYSWIILFYSKFTMYKSELLFCFPLNDMLRVSGAFCPCYWSCRDDKCPQKWTYRSRCRSKTSFQNSPRFIFEPPENDSSLFCFIVTLISFKSQYYLQNLTILEITDRNSEEFFPYFIFGITAFHEFLFLSNSSFSVVKNWRR